MSQKRGNKRRGGAESVDSHDQPLLQNDNISKRARLDKNAANPSVETVSGSNKESAEKNVVRRSGRTPKAKVRDYDDITNALSSPDLPVPKDISVLSNSETVSKVKPPLNVTSDKKKLDFLPSIGDGKAAPENSKEKTNVSFEVGHKRETRKSYQKYLEMSQNTGSDPSTAAVKVVAGVDPPETGLESLGKETHQRSNVTSGTNLKTTGKLSRKFVPEQESLTKNLTITNTTPEKQTEGGWESIPPKVRISKRTPIPKRKFSLLEDSDSDSKKTKNKESVLSETEISYNREHQPLEIELQAKNQQTRPISEPKTKDPPFVSSTTPLGSVLTPKENSRSRRQTSTPQRKHSISKVKHAKSSDSQSLLESHSPCISGETVTDAVIPVSQVDFPDNEQITHQNKTEKKRKRKASTPVVKSVGSDLSTASLESNTSEVKSNFMPKSIIPQNNLKSEEKTKKSAAKKDLKEAQNQGVNADLSSGGDSFAASLSPSFESPKSALSSEVDRSSLGLAVLSGSDPNKKKKKKKQSKVMTTEVSSESEASQQHHHHHHHHHHHKHHKHSKTKKNAETASAEVREEAGEHIILKLHLHKDEKSKKLEAKKQKSKTPSIESIEESKIQRQSKTKKTKNSDTPGKGSSSSDSGKPENQMKLSIKFKGLSKSKGRVELPCRDDVLPSDQESASDKGKQKKDGKKSKSVDIDLSEKQQKTNKKEQEKEPVKLVIKKDKTLFSNLSESLSETYQSSVQKTKKNSSTEQRKKGKEESPCKSSSPAKKPLSAYLLFCKKQRPKVMEENPGLEFSQISKKVGEAWNSLPEEEKQNWKDKAAEMKRQLEASGTLSPGKKTESKADARPDKQLKHTKINSPNKTESVTSNSTAQPIDMAAHLKLLGESLMTVGLLLKQQNQMEVHGSLSVLLDSALCAISPLLFLTSQIPEAAGVSKETQVQILDNIAYIMPGL